MGAGISLTLLPALSLSFFFNSFCPFGLPCMFMEIVYLSKNLIKCSLFHNYRIQTQGSPGPSVETLEKSVMEVCLIIFVVLIP